MGRARRSEKQQHQLPQRQNFPIGVIAQSRPAFAFYLQQWSGLSSARPCDTSLSISTTTIRLRESKDRRRPRLGDLMGLHACACRQLASPDDDFAHAGLSALRPSALGTSFHERFAAFRGGRLSVSRPWRLTGARWPSAFVAAVFAIHPLRVGSVAWVAERKDVLSGVFFMLTLWAYARYVRGNGISSGRYATILVFFALGLMCKPTLVTLPFVLLLLDYWPLRRVSSEEGTRVSVELSFSRNFPLLVFSVASCVATVLAQGAPWFH